MNEKASLARAETEELNKLLTEKMAENDMLIMWTDITKTGISKRPECSLRFDTTLYSHLLGHKLEDWQWYSNRKPLKETFWFVERGKPLLRNNKRCVYLLFNQKWVDSRCDNRYGFTCMAKKQLE